MTSVAGVSTEVLVVSVFAAYAAGSASAGHGTLFAAFAATYVLVAAAAARALDAPREAERR
jgi:hypothetical protein